jgi:photoactive yellow protein
MSTFTFSSPDLFNLIEAATQAEKDAAQFGIVQMRLDCTVAYYNPWEAALAGLSADRVCGRHFFSDVAPCTNNFLVAQRFCDAEELDVIIDYVFTLRMRPTAVKLRLLKSARGAHQYLLVQRP